MKNIHITTNQIISIHLLAVILLLVVFIPQVSAHPALIGTQLGDIIQSESIDYNERQLVFMTVLISVIAITMSAAVLIIYREELPLKKLFSKTI